MKRAYLHMLVLVAALVVLGFVRDDLFKAINYQVREIQSGNETWHFKNWLTFLNDQSLKHYFFYKWFFTVLFFLMHWLVSVYMVWSLFNEKWNFKLTHMAFFILFAVSGAVYLVFGLLLSPDANASRGYEFARLVMGAGQSPIICMLLAVIFMARKKLV